MVSVGGTCLYILAVFLLMTNIIVIAERDRPSTRSSLKASRFDYTTLKQNTLHQLQHEQKSKHQLGGHNWLTPEIITRSGYPQETHVVTTEDNYILEMHRIPYGKDDSRRLTNTSTTKRPAVIVQHCLLCSSADFLLLQPEKALGFKLADAGYDVWLGNFRGNTYSRKHQHLDPEQYEFWRFTWDEMGKYDLPAEIRKVMETTGHERIFYLGHSMGTTAYMVFANEHPEMQENIILSSLMAPVAYVEHMKSPIRLLAPITGPLGWLLEYMNMGEFLPSNVFIDILDKLVCNSNRVPRLCSSILFLLCGWDSSQLDNSIIETIFHHTPAGTSTETILHYAQGVVTTAEFRKFDFGKKENLDIYGQDTPPAYDLGKLTAPVAIYWGENDWLADPRDVERVISAVPNLIASYKVPYSKWNHLDFLYGKDADTLVYAEVLANMDMFLANETLVGKQHQQQRTR